jgi:hypothetical protein
MYTRKQAHNLITHVTQQEQQEQAGKGRGLHLQLEKPTLEVDSSLDYNNDNALSSCSSPIAFIILLQILVYNPRIHENR